MIKSGKLIWSKDQIEKFYNFLPELREYEYYRIDLCVKHKYVKDFENIPKFKSSFVDKKTIKSLKKLQKNLKKFELLREIYTYTDKNTDEECRYPLESFAVYFSINPSNGFKVFNSLQKHYNNLMNSAFETTMSDNKISSQIAYEFSRIEQKFYGLSHKSSNRSKNFIDIDLDIDKEKHNYVLKNIIHEFKMQGLRFMVIETIGGYHILIDRNTIKYNYTEIINKSNEEVKKSKNDKYEVIINSAAFIPLPGTTRGGFNVIIKDIFENNK